MQAIPSVPWQAPSPSPSQRLDVRYVGTGSGLFFVAAKNILLTLVTLGLYMPWARTERRKYIWQNIEVGGQRLRYHGTGREVAIGYLKVAVVYLLLFGLPLGISAVNRHAGLVAQWVGIVAIVPLVPIAVFGSLRYRLSRTSLRGVRFGLATGAPGYVRLWLVTMLLSVLTLGLWAPYGNNRLHRYLVSRHRYGSEPFDYDGEDREAWSITMRGVLLSIVTLGFYYSWYIANIARFRVGHTRFQGARGRLDITGGDVFQILIVAYFGTIFTLGIAVPWVTTYALQVFTSKLSFDGPIDFARVEQRPVEGGAAGDDLASALDLGLEL